MAPRPDLADLLTRAAREINAHGDLDSTLSSVVRWLHAALPPGHHVALCLQRRPGVVETVAVSDDLVHDLEAAQHEGGEGTCPVALAGREVALADGVPGRSDWERYHPVAVRHGVTGQLSVRLDGSDRLWGALTVYATEAAHDPATGAGNGSSAFSPATERLTTLFAAHAAIALERAHREENLRIALATRRLIGQALGLAMERFELDEDLAFRYLVRLSSTANVKLRDIAQELVDEANKKASSGA